MPTSNFFFLHIISFLVLHNEEIFHIAMLASSNILLHVIAHLMLNISVQIFPRPIT